MTFKHRSPFFAVALAISASVLTSPGAVRAQDAPGGAQLFEIEAHSTVDLYVPASAMTKEKSELVRGGAISLTHSDLVIKGTYGVFRNGVRTAKVVNKFEVGENVTKDSGEKVHRLGLMSGPRLNVPKGPSEKSKRTPEAFGSLADRSHQFKSLAIHGDTMDIEWGNGGKDVWVRNSPPPEKSAEKIEPRLLAVHSAVNLMQGTWTLKERLTPSGKPHAKPLEGTTVFDLTIDPTTGHATGTLQSNERGVLDLDQCVEE